MKKSPMQHRAFWERCLDLWLICWITYCACEFLMRMIFYRETMPHLRDYSILGWTQHIVFAFAYYGIFTKSTNWLASTQPKDGLHPLRAVGGFFRRDWKQILLLIGSAILYETLQVCFPDSDDVFSAFLVILFPSASVIHVPVIRTLIGVSLSLASMLLPHLFEKRTKM